MAEGLTIEELRGRIDVIDDQLVRLLNVRVACAVEIGRLKQGKGVAIYQPEREKQVPLFENLPDTMLPPLNLLDESEKHIEVMSTLGQGTTSTIYLPQAEEVQDTQPPRRTVVQVALRGTETILVVEDEILVRSLAESIIQDDHLQTVSAANAEDALSLLQSGQMIDVLFTDLGLGAGLQGGLYLALAARKLRPGLSVLYTTGQRVTNGMMASFVEPHGFLAKPYAADQLCMALGNSLRQGRRLN